MLESIVPLLLVVHVAATWFMTGLIWFVQVVHYPLFALTGATGFADYERRHTALTTWVVAPTMLIEALSALLLVWLRPGGVAMWQAWTGLALLGVIWSSTALLQVPCHQRLGRGFDPAEHANLVRSNWIRTIAWSLRAVLVGGMVWNAMG